MWWTGWRHSGNRWNHTESNTPGRWYWWRKNMQKVGWQREVQPWQEQTFIVFFFLLLFFLIMVQDLRMFRKCESGRVSISSLRVNIIKRMRSNLPSISYSDAGGHWTAAACCLKRNTHRWHMMCLKATCKLTHLLDRHVSFRVDARECVRIHTGYITVLFPGTDASSMLQKCSNFFSHFCLGLGNMLCSPCDGIEMCPPGEIWQHRFHRGDYPCHSHRMHCYTEFPGIT